jgi:hypothetical protein
MSRAAQQARIDAAVLAGAFERPLSIRDAIDTFRRNWNRQRMTGIRQDLSLPPLDHAQMREALDVAFADYWGARGFVAYGEDRKLLDDLRGAICAANARHNAGRGKVSATAELRRRLRERDGDACWVCGHDLGDNATIEHKVALANGGTWALGNLALAHRECNRALARLPLAAKEAARAAIQQEQEGVA